MASDDAWIDELMARLAPLGAVSFRKMFGGVGFWEHGDMFALLDSSGRLHFKVDQVSRGRYEEAGMDAFSPQTTPQRAPMTMPYFEVPAEVLADEALFAEWATQAIAVGHSTAKRRR